MTGEASVQPRKRRVLAAALFVAGVFGMALGAGGLVLPASPAGAANVYGPGIGPQAPTGHWGGAYVLTGVPGYAYCIEPGDADPVELPATQWSPVPYPGSGVYSDGEMAALAFFAQQYEGSGYPGYSVNTTVAAIAQIAYASGGGTTPPVSQGPPALVAFITAWMQTYAGPWTIALSMTPPSGSTFDTGTNYDGTITVTSADGDGVGGLSLIAPPVGGAGEITNFVWVGASTTNAAGQIAFQWNISNPGAFSAPNIDVVGTAVGSAPPTYARSPFGSALSWEEEEANELALGRRIPNESTSILEIEDEVAQEQKPVAEGRDTSRLDDRLLKLGLINFKVGLIHRKTDEGEVSKAPGDTKSNRPDAHSERRNCILSVIHYSLSEGAPSARTQRNRFKAPAPQLHAAR